MSLSYFDSTTVNDGTNVTSHLNLASLVTALQTVYPGDTYFDTTSEIGSVYVYYQHIDGRQIKKIVHSPLTNSGSVQWSSFARDGAWQKNRIKVFDKDGATNTLYRTHIGALEDLDHTSGIMSLNIS